MKSLVVLFFGILFWTQSAFASRASVSFYARSGEAFQVVIDGRLINKYPSDKIRLNEITYGYHKAEIRFPDRYGVLVHRARIYLEPGYETEYRVQLSGRRRNIELQKMRVIPINGGIVPPYAGNPNLTRYQITIIPIGAMTVTAGIIPMAKMGSTITGPVTMNAGI